MSTDVFPFSVWLSGTNQNSIPANDNALRVEVITAPVLSILSAQPGSPAEGDQHILGASPSGAQWSSFFEDDVVIFKGGTWLAFSPYVGWIKYNQDDDTNYQYDSGWTAFAGGGGGSVISVNARNGTVVVPTCIPIACSDETTALTSGAAKVTFRMPFAMTSVTVRASLTTAQASGSIFTVDINESGASILSTKLTIDNTEKTSTTAATPPVVSDSSLADDAEITIDVDQIGNGTAKGLKVYLIGVV
jgi:hypothetical protein